MMIESSSWTNSHIQSDSGRTVMVLFVLNRETHFSCDLLVNQTYKIPGLEARVRPSKHAVDIQ